MKTMRFPIFGTGFWSRYQLAAWRELEGAECVALFNRTKSNVQNKPGMNGTDLRVISEKFS